MAKVYDSKGNEVKVDSKTEKARRAAFEQISKKAILVNLDRRQISNLPYDVNLTAKIAKDYGLESPDLIQVRKFLFNPQRLAKIRSLVNDALMMIWNHTRPWDNIGYRILPMEFHDDFQEAFSKIKDEWEEEVENFVDNYDSYVAEAKKMLGKAFNKNNYPDKAQVKDMFELSVITAQMPDIDDIRINMSGPELMQMQQDITEKFEGTIESTVEELSNLVEKGNPDAYELFKLARSLNNVTKNSEVEVRLAELEQLLEEKGLTPDANSMMVMDDLEDLDEELINNTVASRTTKGAPVEDLEDDEDDDIVEML